MTTTTTTTAHDLATSIHHLYDVTRAFAAKTVEEYLTRMEDVDDHQIDRNAIPADDVAFIKSTFANQQRHGNFGARELDAVADAAEAFNLKRGNRDQERYDRECAIRRALAAGAGVSAVAGVAGVSYAYATDLADTNTGDDF